MSNDEPIPDEPAETIHGPDSTETPVTESESGPRDAADSASPESASPASAGEETPPSGRGKIVAWWATIAGICLIILLGSTFVTRSYLIRRTYEMENWRPPYLAKLEENLLATNRDGREVELGDLRGKVFVAGYNYTDCPAGCLGLASVMKTLHEKFGHLPIFHLVSVSVDPTADTPAKMDAWVKERGVDAQNWWFLTGDEEIIRGYMLSQFKFFAVEEVTDPEKIAQVGRWAHDLRLALVDEKANIRGYYDVLHSEYGEQEITRLERDIRMVLNPDLKLEDVQ